MSTVTLVEVLESRDKRRLFQQRMLKKHDRPLLSFTINMPGDVKDCHASRFAFDQGLKALVSLLENRQWLCLDTYTELENTGPLALMAIDAPDATSIKQAMMTLESTHPLGRLFDLDVLDVSGRILSRREFGNQARQCLVCDSDAVLCARAQAHDIQELRSHINQLVAAQQ